MLQCPKRRESRAGRDIPARLVLSHPALFGLDIVAGRTMTRIATGSITDIQSTAGRLTAADLLAGHHSFLTRPESLPARRACGPSRRASTSKAFRRRAAQASGPRSRWRGSWSDCRGSGRLGPSRRPRAKCPRSPSARQLRRTPRPLTSNVTPLHCF
jgi:hypothetical protein